jgi:hypothetical protein
MTERLTALHEAGHAVAYVRLFPGNYNFSITVAPNLEQGSAGSHHAEAVEFEWTDDPDAHAKQNDDFRKKAVQCCAGYAAVRVAGYSEAEAVAGCRSVFEQAEWCGLEETKQRALELMSRPENVAAVKRIAEELLRRKTLTGDEYDILIDVADGVTTEADYQQFLLMKSAR